MNLKNLSAEKKNHKFFDLKLKDSKIKSIYQKFEKKVKLTKKFAVAVSGGSDSLALSFLSKIYSIKNKVNVNFYIVNHKLRHDSTQEAINVNQLLKKIMLVSLQ